MNDKRLFLLGGHDLEMVEIKKILEKYGEVYQDNNLLWGAKLSSYEDVLDFDGTIYGIELEEDITLPDNYVSIDHHNENSDRKSSLKQIAKLLHVELTREQELISANDSRYIDGMKALCATQKEIDDIRAADRQAQGITQEDEEKARLSIEKSNSNTIYAYTPYFACISDLIYDKYDSYLIYDDTKLSFYGHELLAVKKFLHSFDITQESYYYGGGEFGFLGIKESVLTKEKIENLIKEFNKMKKSPEEIYSYHTFMLPFTFSGQFNNDQKNWNYKKFKIEKQRDYNEYIYFYKHVQDAIYNKEEKEQSISRYYEYTNQSGKYIINCKKGDFELELDGISLRIFNTQVAILSFNLKNTKLEQSKIEDILAINDFGRRIYPQFLGENFICEPKNAFLANCLTLQLEDNEPLSEDFEKYNNLSHIKLLPKFIEYLIEKNFQSEIRPIIDDRMFVISWYGNKHFSESLQGENYIENDKWYEYVFVDGDGKTVHSKNKQTDLIVHATYDRWMDNPWGCTLFGITRYSFVAVTNESDFAKNVILQHMQTMYFQMFSLLLAYRASIIKFSDDIQDTTAKDKDIIAIRTKELYKRYLDFLNKLYFNEVTAQDQGIELYNQAKEIMDLEKYMADVDKEINELHSYVDLMEEQARTISMDKISKLGSFLLLPALLTSFLGMNIIDFGKYKDLIYSENITSTIVFVIIALSSFVTPIVMKITSRSKGES